VLLPLELLGAPEGSRLVQACLDVDSLTVHLTITAPTAACPLCRSDTPRVHSRYTRRLDDLPCLGRCVRLRIAVRRFVCPRTDCPRRIFAERLPRFAAPWARTTDRLRRTHIAIGSSLGGEAGARLAARMAMATSPDTLLRRVKRLKGEPAAPPRVVGIDDWAWRKGRRYGTIVVDLERSDVIDLLPDCDADTVAAWLKAHPEVEVVGRDRSQTYAQAVTEGASQAQQVADRWHLLENLREAIERVFERHSAVVEAALKDPELPSEPARDPAVPEAAAVASAVEPPAEPARDPAVSEAAAVVSAVEPPALQPPSDPGSESPRLQAQRAKRQKRVDRFEQVHERHRRGHSARRIARELGMSRNAVRRYLRCKECPDWRPGRAWRCRWDAQRQWLDARLAEGETNAADLHRQLTARGFRGSYCSVQRYVRRRLGVAGKKRERVDATRPSDPPPSPRRLSFEWVRRPENRKPEEQKRIDAIRACSDELASALDLADEFAALLRKRSSGTLSDWLMKGEASSSPEIWRYAEGIRRDGSAVLAAVTQRWSNGPVEGHINRLKLIKRQMYGRTGFVLLRARVVHAP
jgi:transposase